MAEDDFVKIKTHYLRDLLYPLNLDKPVNARFVDQTPWCSNYTVETKIGFWGERSIRVIRIRKTFQSTDLTIREHISIVNLSSK